MKEHKLATGMYGDMCPYCWGVNKEERSMIRLHRSDSHDYCGPKGSNGECTSGVEWCDKCGVVRMTVNHGNAKSATVFVPGDDFKG